MKKLLTYLLLVAAVASQAQMKGKMEVFDLANAKLHIYTSAETMHDVSAIVESETSLIILEQPSFYKSIAEFNDYVKSLQKPIVKVVANYHVGGLADYDPKIVVMVEGMPEFEKGPKYSGMMSRFAKNFAGAMDTRPHKAVKTVPLNSTQKWGGIEFEFTPGNSSDFPAAVIKIDNSAYYTHFPPAKSHPSTIQVGSREAVDNLLGELKKAKTANCKLYFGSHGAPATMEDLDFNIEYLQKINSILATAPDSDTFGQMVIAAYPKLDGVSNVRNLAKSLYPNEVVDAEKSSVKQLMNSYFESVSNIDKELARRVWADDSRVSLTNAMGQFFGFESIFNDFIFKAFGAMKSRKLYSASEVVNIYGNTAIVTLYWLFDTIQPDGSPRQTSGRETLVCEKINNEWKLVHVHYSGMPNPR